MLDKAVFYFFAGLAVLSAVLVVTRRNAVHSAIFLITALLATAGIFLQLHAEFLFAVQIILYVGGIMVLFIFVIMLVNLDVALHQLQFNRQWWLALLLALVVGAQFYLAFYVARSGEQGRDILGLPQAAAVQLEPNTELVGKALFQNYMLPFEIASILLLVAMIGAVVMAKRKV
ncbi:MAG TPA: NADH-quinone oxidoreductase subunit J [Candidatus Acidoferrales bacterium]|jgi:NADH-quinone oxidoreductase subunit J|nr:NADH-quinone oxidoreductase subunit J [Candidatus Acidoferrales bacterium]